MLYFARWKTTLIWMAVFVSAMVALPNILSKNTLEAMPDWLPKGPSLEARTQRDH
jgi:SecD/SecF fusion protein